MVVVVLLCIYLAALQAESADNSIMTMAVWQLAFDKYALGAAMVQSGGEWSLSVHEQALSLYLVVNCRQAAVGLHVCESTFRSLHEGGSCPLHSVALESCWFVIGGWPQGVHP